VVSLGEKKKEKEPMKEYMDGLKNVNRKTRGASSHGRNRSNYSSYS
jgi:hypothetical protein